MSIFPYQAVLFDLDGTLFDSYESIASSLRNALAAQHYKLPAGFDMHVLIGPPLRDSLPSLLKVSQEDIQRVILAEREDFFRGGWRLMRMYPGIRSLLETLREAGVYTAVVTNKPVAMTELLIREFHLEGYFDRVIGDPGEDSPLRKADMIRLALSGAEGKAVMVGDRRFDMEAARENHIDGIGVGYGYGSKEELLSAGASLFVPDTDALYTALCGDHAPARGFFLSIEGPDGSGKSTQIRLLSEKLIQYGFDVKLTREPGGCPISEKIRGIILDNANAEMCGSCEALLYAASRAQHVHEVILPSLAAGKLVLSDRFVDSSVAYQGGGRRLGVEKVQAINAPAVENCLPDATIYLRISAEKALMRRYSASEPDRLEREALSFHQRVEAAYEEIIRGQPERFLVVDADRDAESIAADIWTSVLDRIAPSTRKGGE